MKWMLALFIYGTVVLLQIFLIIIFCSPLFRRWRRRTRKFKKFYEDEDTKHAFRYTNAMLKSREDTKIK